MEKGKSVEIIKIGNGWMVRPVYDLRNDNRGSNEDTFVFNSLQYSKDQDATMNETTLLGWLEKHFGE